MPTYKYRAVCESGNIIRSITIASNKQHLFQKLKQRKQQLIAYRRLWKLQSILLTKTRKMRRKDLIEFCLHMEHMDRAGIHLLDSLRDACNSYTDPYSQGLLEDLYTTVKGGLLLSQALKNHPHVFDDFFVDIITISETTGRLYQGFAKLSHHFIWLEETQEKLLKAVRYPIFIGLVIISVFITLMTYLMPQLTTFLDTLDAELSYVTVSLIEISQFIATWSPLMLILIGTFTTLLYVLTKFSITVKTKVDQATMLLPVTGDLIKKIALSKFFHFFALTVSAKVDILRCLKLSAQNMPNLFLCNKINVIRDSVENGNTLANSFQDSGLFPSFVTHLIKVGETTNSLDTMLQTIHDSYVRDVNYRIDQLVPLIEPTLLLSMGGLLLWIVIGIFYPIYDSIGLMEL